MAENTEVHWAFPAIWSHMELLQGPAVEITVGKKDASGSNKEGCQKWCLSVALLSHHSPFLEKECKQMAVDTPTMSVALPDTSPITFSGFVDWMFKGSSEESVTDQLDPTAIHPYAADWILGAKLECIDFQNYAMEKLYNHTLEGSDNPLVVTPAAMDKMLTNEGNIYLQWFMRCFVCTHFKNESLVKGELYEWIGVPQKHYLFLRDLLISLKYNTGVKEMPPRERYILKKKETSPIPSTDKTNGMVTPAKRGADGTPKSKDTLALRGEVVGSSRADTREASIANDKTGNTVKGDGKVVKEEKTEVVTPGNLTQAGTIKCELTDT
ncbi:hypothetical protein A1F99_118200 [Pyrenophora tritici-repentis]|nr:hypothetical protein A1F99_118200 [Pyrenophora tritici-repentis]